MKNLIAVLVLGVLAVLFAGPPIGADKDTDDVPVIDNRLAFVFGTECNFTRKDWQSLDEKEERDARLERAFDAIQCSTHIRDSKRWSRDLYKKCYGFSYWQFIIYQARRCKETRAEERRNRRARWLDFERYIENLKTKYYLCQQQYYWDRQHLKCKGQAMDIYPNGVHPPYDEGQDAQYYADYTDWLLGYSDPRFPQHLLPAED